MMAEAEGPPEPGEAFPEVWAATGFVIARKARRPSAARLM
jgi:hypothetical protein